MRDFTDQRDASTEDQIWFVEHPPVYTLGSNADPRHILSAQDVPIVKTDRGGQVTYHAPGQQVVYAMLDLKRLGIGIRALVQALENAVIETVADYGLRACARRDAPGVYVDGKKLAALGLRVRRGCSYHGIAVNVNLDLEPFARINPCGFEDLAVTQLADICDVGDLEQFRRDMDRNLRCRFGET